MVLHKSKQRDMIMDYMQQMASHESADDIFIGVNKYEKKISLATLYRNLTILEATNQIQKVALKDGRWLYDKTSKPHYHFLCDKCQKLFDMDVDYDQHLIATVKDNNIANTIHSYDITFRGICKNCQ
ncbi:MAG: Fur family transcriptional regulator [Breznakia sp.]